MKRTFIFALILALAFTMCGLSGCAGSNKDGEQGKISDDVTIEADGEKSLADYDEFEKMNTPYGYRVTTRKSGMAFMQIDVPASYNYGVQNARHIEISAPEDDPHIHGAKIHMLYDFTESAFSDEDQVDNTRIYDSSFYSELFSWEIPHLTYRIDGRNCSPREFDLADETTGNFDFAKKELAVTRQLAKGVDVYSSSGDLGPDSCNQLTYFFRWNDIPCCMTTIVKDDCVEAAETIMEYMISSCTYLPSRINKTQEYKLESCSLTLPAEMVEGSSTNTAYIPAGTIKNASAGIAIGEFIVDTDKTTPVTLKSMSSTYATAIARQLSQGAASTFDMYTTTDKVKKSHLRLCGKNTKHFTSTVSMITEANTDMAGRFYGNPCTCFFDTLVTTDGDKQHIIAVWYQAPQKTAAMSILSLAANSASFD